MYIPVRVHSSIGQLPELLSKNPSHIIYTSSHKYYSLFVPSDLFSADRGRSLRVAMPCGCPCDRSTPRYQYMKDFPSGWTHRCACQCCGHSSCHVRVPLSDTYCWVCYNSWREHNTPTQTEDKEKDAHEEGPKRKKRRRDDKPTAQSSSAPTTNSAEH